MKKKSLERSEINKKLKFCGNLYFDEFSLIFHCNTNVPLNCPCECVKRCPAYEIKQIEIGIIDIILME